MTAQRRQPPAEVVVASSLHRALTILSHVERGFTPIDTLRPYVASAVVRLWPPRPPLPPGQPITPVKVNVHTVRLFDDDCRAHAAATIRRPDGRTSGFIGELGRASQRRRWLVTELTAVEERALVGPTERPRYADHLPDRVDRLIGATSQAHDDALEQLRRARGQLDELTRAAHAKGRPSRLLRDEQRAAAQAVKRWQVHVEQLAEELAAYRQAHRDRRARQQAISVDGASAKGAARPLRPPAQTLDVASDVEGPDVTIER